MVPTHLILVTEVGCKKIKDNKIYFLAANSNPYNNKLKGISKTEKERTCVWSSSPCEQIQIPWIWTVLHATIFWLFWRKILSNNIQSETKVEILPQVKYGNVCRHQKKLCMSAIHSISYGEPGHLPNRNIHDLQCVMRRTFRFWLGLTLFRISEKN